MSEPEDEANDVPEGVALFPEIPAELGVDPLLLAVLHAVVFIAGSDPHIVQPDASDEAIVALAGYLQRLQGEQLRRIHEDMACLVAYARQQKWARGLISSLKSFLADMGVEENKK
jgi:hypothetical protein